MLANKHEFNKQTVERVAGGFGKDPWKWNSEMSAQP